MSYLSKDAVWTINPFFCNSTFVNFKIFIFLLEWIYNDASCKYTAIIKFENLWQRNRDFTNFFLEFLGLISELNWNEAARVTAF